MARTWENIHKPKLKMILKKVQLWNADYIVPIGRKSAKLFRTLGGMDRELVSRVFYKEYFKYSDAPLTGKRVAVIDDAAKTTSTLADNRQLFEEKGAKVRTFALVGHTQLTDDPSSCYDPLAEIEEYISEPSYEDFLLAEAEYLLKEGFYQDLNHLTLEMEIPPFTYGSAASLKDLLRFHGYAYVVPPYANVPLKWSVIDPDFAKSSLLQIPSGIVKLRFHGTQGFVTCVPMVFPDITVSDKCQLFALRTPFELPCQMIRARKEHAMDELCYWSISLLLSAELGRLFLAFLRHEYEDTSTFLAKIQDLKVRGIDFMRYFGIDKATRLAQGIREFLLKKDYTADDQLQNYLEKTIVPRRSKLLEGTFSEESLAKVIDHLREEYRKACEEAGTHRGVSYFISLSKMKDISGANELFLIEALDFLCDLGTLVPITQVTPSTIQRTWRTGEVKEDTSLKRTHVLIPMAINVIADELHLKSRRVGALLLLKILSNFVYDYPSKPPLYDRIHRIVREPDVHGTTPKVSHPLRAQHPVPIYHYKMLGDRYFAEVEEPVRGDPKRRLRRVWFSARPDAMKDIDQQFDNTQAVTRDEITNYISFLSQLRRRTNSTDILTALSICRTPDSFYWHAHKNLKLWTTEFYRFLNSLQIPYTEDLRKGPLHRSGEISQAGLKKIKMWIDFDTYVNKMKAKMIDTRFDTPLKRILKNIDSNRELPILRDIRRILSIQRALTGVALVKIFPPTKRRSLDRRVRWAHLEFERHKFAFDIASLLKAEDVASIKRILESAYFEISYLVETLPEPKPESEEERNKMLYLEIAQNRAAKVCVDMGWMSPGFVYWDLTGSRDSGDETVPRTASMYEESDKITGRFGGKCITVRPNGEDRLLYIFSSPIAALRAAAFSMKRFVETNNLVKGGVSHALLSTGNEYSALIPAMGLAKDLCEFKSKAFINRKDILLSSEMVNYLEKEGIERDYFIKLDDVVLERKTGEKGTLDVYRFDWARFCKDMR